MKDKGMTQVELASKIGKDQTLISRYVSGKIEISVEVARSIAEALELDFEELRQQLKRDKLERRKANLRAEFKDIIDEGEEIDRSGEHYYVGAAALLESVGVIYIPLMDSIPSGRYDQRREKATRYHLPPGVQMDTEEAFAIKASGEDMTDDVVSEGDIIVVDPGAEAQDGTRVLVSLNGKPALGKIYREGENAVLQLSRRAIVLSQKDKIVGPMVLCNKIFTSSLRKGKK